MAEGQAPFLRFLLQASPAQLRFLLGSITPPQLDAIGEVSYNVLYGVVEVKELSRHRHYIRLLGDRTVSSRRRRALVKTRPNLVVQLVKAVVQ